MTDIKQPEAIPQNLRQITDNMTDVNTVLIERSELLRLHEENQTLREKNGLLKYALTEHETLQAENAELEAMLDAVGAGGVGESIKPQIQADTAQEPGAGIPASVPTGWKLVPMEPTAAMLDAAFDTEVVHTEWGVDAFVENTDEVYGAMLAAAPEAPAQQKPVAHLPCCGYTDTSALQWNQYNGVAQCHNCGQVYAAPQPTENLHCKSTQKRLATLWGYEKARQPLTDEQIKAAVRHLYGSDAVAAMAVTGDIETARAIEAAHGITGGQQ